MCDDGYFNSSSRLTRTALLDALQRPDDHALWRGYVDEYRPRLVAFGRRAGLAEPDAEDVAQRTLATFCGALRRGRYDRQKGRLRHWLFKILRNQIATWRRTRPRRESPVDQSPDRTDFFERLPARNSRSRFREVEYQLAKLRRCLETVRTEVDERTFRAFDRFALQGRPAEEVGHDLGMTANAVFSAKRRILRRVRELASHETV